MALDPVVPRSRRNLLAAAVGGVAGLLVGTLARPASADATTGTMVYGTSMDEGVDQTTLTSSGAFTAVFQNSGNGIPVQGFASGGQAGVLGANSPGGSGVVGESPQGNGVQGLSTSGTGVNGISTSGIGVIGTSTSSVGVIGGSAATDQPGLYGQSTGNNTGVVGISGSGFFSLPSPTPARTGVYGYVAQDATAAGVKGESIGGTGTAGISSTGPGIQGSSTSGNGVIGASSSSSGVSGSSVSAIGVAGSSTASLQPAIRGFSDGANTGVFGFSRNFGAGSPPATPANSGVYGYAAEDATAVGVKGESTAGTGVVGVSGSGRGVFGQSNADAGVMGYVGGSTPPVPPITGAGVLGANLGGHDLFAGLSGRIGFVPAPVVNDLATGDLFLDTGGNLWVCTAAGLIGSIRKLAGPATAGSLHPIVPARVYDSRHSGGSLSVSGLRTISIATATTGGTIVPSGATAVAYNLTITATIGTGWLGVVPAGSTFGGTSSINWFGPGQTLANGGIVKLGGDRRCDVWIGGQAGGSTQFIVDITGYYA